MEFLGQVFRPGLVPVGDEHGPNAIFDQVPGRQIAHLAGAKNHYRRLRKIAQQLLRQFDRRIADRHRAEGNLRFGADFLAGGDRPVKQRIQHRRSRAAILGDRIGLLDLT